MQRQFNPHDITSRNFNPTIQSNTLRVRNREYSLNGLLNYDSYPEYEIGVPGFESWYGHKFVY